MLEGYDKDWSPVTEKNTAALGNMYEGTYTVKLRAQCAEGVWCEPITYTFNVLPPWWRTRWMYLVYAITFLAGLRFFVKWRERRIVLEKGMLEKKITARTLELRGEKEKVEITLAELKSAQTQLIQSEKMASLGELTTGIAHEIQNPLNFVNNFSEVSKELLDEMKSGLDNGNAKDAKDIANNVIQNLEKINYHGKRADAIVKGMLQHSRATT